MSDWDAFSPLKYTTSWTLFLCIFLLSIWSLGDIYYDNQTFVLRSGHSETLGHTVKSEGSSQKLHASQWLDAHFCMTSFGNLCQRKPTEGKIPV